MGNKVATLLILASCLYGQEILEVVGEGSNKSFLVGRSFPNIQSVRAVNSSNVVGVTSNSIVRCNIESLSCATLVEERSIDSFSFSRVDNLPQVITSGEEIYFFANHPQVTVASRPAVAAFSYRNGRVLDLIPILSKVRFRSSSGSTTEKFMVSVFLAEAWDGKFILFALLADGLSSAAKVSMYLIEIASNHQATLGISDVTLLMDMDEAFKTNAAVSIGCTSRSNYLTTTASRNQLAGSDVETFLFELMVGNKAGSLQPALSDQSLKTRRALIRLACNENTVSVIFGSDAQGKPRFLKMRDGEAGLKDFFSGSSIEGIGFSNPTNHILTLAGKHYFTAQTGGNQSVFSIDSSGKGVVEIANLPLTISSIDWRGRLFVTSTLGGTTKFWAHYTPTTFNSLKGLAGIPVVVSCQDCIFPGSQTEFVLRGQKLTFIQKGETLELNIPNDTPAGIHTITMNLAGKFFRQIELTVTVTVTPSASISVVNGASFEPGKVSVGSHATLYGKGGNFGTAESAGAIARFNLGGAAVLVCGIPSRMFFNSGGGQINFLIPKDITAPRDCEVEARVGNLSAKTTVRVEMQSPTLFTYFEKVNPDGSVDTSSQLPMVTHADYSLVGSGKGNVLNSQSKEGEVVILWGTGICTISPAVPDGSDAPLDGSARCTEAPIVNIGGVSADVLFSGLAPGFSGLWQVVVRVPQGTLAGDNFLWLGENPRSPVYKLWVGGR